MKGPGPRRSGGGGALGRLARAALALLLRLFPPAFGARFRADMEEAVEDRLGDAEARGSWAVARATLATGGDLAASAAKEWMRPAWTGRTTGTSTTGGAVIDAVWGDVRFAVRSLVRRPGFSAVALATLALGIGANTAIFSVVNGVLLRPLPYPEPDGLAMVWSRSVDDPDGESVMSLEDLRDVESLPSFRTVEGYNGSSATLTGTGSPQVVPAARLTGGILELMGAAPALGRDLRRDEAGPDAPLRVLISWDLWQERFQGAADVVGRSLEIAERTYEVVGVAPKGFDFPDGARLWYGEQNAGSEGCQRGCSTLAVIARLTAPGAFDAAQAELDGLGERLAAEYPDSNFDTRFRVERLSDQVVGDVRTGLWILLGAVGLVLLIACANVANLLLVRASSRRTEVAVRAALGAGRRRLVAQVMTESVILAVAGALGGLVLAAVGIDALRSLAADTVPRIDEVSVDGAVLAFTAAVAVSVALLFGLSPALHLSRTPLTEGMGTGLRGGAPRSEVRSRGFLLAAEVGLSLVLLVGAGLLLRSFQRLYAVELGYETREVVRFATSLPSTRYPELEDVATFYRSLEARIAALPGVEGVGYVFGSPLGNGNITGGVLVDGRPEPEPGEDTYASIKPSSPGYLDVLGIPLVRGRGIEPGDDASSPPVAVVNQTFVRENFPTGDVLGQRVRITANFGYVPETPTWEIVGVVADVRSRGPRREPVAEIYVPHAQFGPGFVDVVVRSAPGVSGLLDGVRTEVEALDPNVPLRGVGTLREAVDRVAAPTRLYLTLVAAFAGLAVFLAAVGLYGVVAFLVAGRTREIGIRMALGARRVEITRLVVVQGLRPAGWGLAVGLAAAIAGARLMEGVLFQVQARDPLILVSVTVLLTGVVIAASAVPARRAARVAPSEALRTE